MRRVLCIVLLILTACSASQRDADDTAQRLASHAHRLTGAANDYDALLAAIDGAHVVLLGEATHGTHEFYRERARITQRLIREKRFTALALEADWADAARVDRYVRGLGNDRTAEEALGGFTNFPRWMWRNREFAELVEWLRQHNASQPLKVGVYGLDLYGIEESKAALPAHLPKKLQELQALYDKTSNSDKARLDELFYALQNARVVANGEEYFRESRLGRVSTWNLRDRHMVVTLDALQRYLLRRNGHADVVVWAHNSHVGDARATARAQFGEWNLGQLVREHWHPRASFTVGFFTDTGTVVAAKNWDEEPRLQQLRPAIRGSHAALLHETGIPAFYLILKEIETTFVRRPRQQRAVGVIYRPETEMESHYYTATLREQFDAVVHVDVTKGLAALD